MKDIKVETLIMSEVQKAVEIFEKYGIKTRLDANNQIIISHYCQPKDKTFEELGINEDELIKNVIACEGCFDTRKSKLTTFPLVVSKEIRLHQDTNIIEMPNLKAVVSFVTNSKLKKLPKLKAVGSISLENSPIRTLPKLKEAGLLIAQNSALRELELLEKVKKLCIIDCAFENLKNLEEADDIFICSTKPDEKINIKSLVNLEEVKNLFVANAALKSLPRLKKADKIAFYNCEIKNVKSSVCSNVEIQTNIKDEELSEKFDTFTDWYNSDIFNQSMNLLGEIINKIQS